MPLTHLPVARAAFCEALRDVIAPAAAAAFPARLRRLCGAGGARLRVLDAFLVRYTAGAGGAAELPMHSDQGQLSLTLALNGGAAAFEGGGTLFEGSGAAIAPPTGHALLFPSETLHGGERITSGRRYIIVAFMYVDSADAAAAAADEVSAAVRLAMDGSVSASPGHVSRDDMS
jgi:hypothetical protein